MNKQTKLLYFTAEFKAMGDLVGNNKLNKGEFIRLLMLLGYPGGREGSEKLWQAKVPQAAYMNLDEYIQMMMDKNIFESTKMWRMLFAEFDTDGSGFASPDEVKMGLEKIGLTVGPVMEEKLQKMDSNKDGKINYSDFLRMQLKQSK